MKRLFYILGCYIVLHSFSGCGDSSPYLEDKGQISPNARYLYLETNSLSFEAVPTTAQTLNVKATSTPWQFTGMESWLSVNPTTGKDNTSVNVSATENKSGDTSRSCILTLASTAPDYSYNHTVSVTQAYATPYIKAESASLSFSGPSSTQSVAVSSNVSWTPSCSSNWVSFSKQDDNLQVTVSENTTNVSRTAIIELNGSNVSASITVLQSAVGITTDQTSTIEFENTAGSYIINITSEGAWTAETSQSWIMVTPESGTAGTSQLTISTTPNESTNERNGFVYLKIAGNTLVQIPVTQKGIYLTVDPTTLRFGSTSSQQILSVRSNISWSVLSAPSWLSLSENKGTGSTNITVTAQENSLTTDREGDIVIGNEGSSLNATIKVTQTGKTFSDLIASLSFSDQAGQQYVDIETDGQWTVSTDYSWINLNPISGNGNGRLAVSVTENTSDEKRDGVVAVTVGNTTKNISVSQSGKYFTVNSGGQATIPSTGGSHAVTFNTNESWTAKTSSSWITLSPTSGNGDATITIKAGDNASIYARTDTTYITPAHIQGIKVITKQAARYLTVNTSQLSFFAKGGTSEVVTITTDASFSITANVSWLTINKNGKTFTVTATENTSLDTRYGKVTVSMTGLVNSESYSVDIDVVQKAPGGTFTINWFGEDQNWNF